MSHRRTPLPIPSDPGQSSGDASSDHEVLSNPEQSSSDASLDHEEYFKLKEAYLKVIDLYSGASLDTNKLRDELKVAHAVLGITQQKATQARDEKAAAEAEVQNLLVDATATYDAAFPMQTTNDLATTPEEHLRAL